MATPGDTSATFCAALVDEWIRAGVTHAVVAPGSRSTPLAVALASRPELRLHIFHDERSAGFAALGIGRASGYPAVLLCTSGTAAAHFLAPVHEANLSRIPMIVCTADRPPELRDVAAPQTIDQTKLFGDAVRWFHDPGVPSEDARTTWRSLARRTVAAAIGSLPGPVHLNLPFREPLLGTVGALPAVQDAEVARAVLGVDSGAVAAVARALSGAKGVIVAGRGATPEVVDAARALGWPVFADATSGLRNGDAHVINGFDPVLRATDFSDAHVPDVVMRVGDPPASKVLAQWTARTGARIVQVKDHESVVDPDHSVSVSLTGPVAKVMSLIAGGVQPCDEKWMNDWRAASDAAQQALDAELATHFCEPAIARAVTRACPAGSNLVVSSSMPIRDIEWFGTDTTDVTVHANRGANGIDGVVSTAVGVALATGAPTTLYIGDIAMVHDANGLWGVRSRDVDLTIVVTNNDGGSIFSFLPQASQVTTETFETLFGTPHGVDFSALAAAHGIPHVLVEDAAALEKALVGTGTRMIEVKTDRSVNVAAHDAVNAAVVRAVSAL